MEQIGQNEPSSHAAMQGENRLDSGENAQHEEGSQAAAQEVNQQTVQVEKQAAGQENQAAMQGRNSLAGLENQAAAQGRNPLAGLGNQPVTRGINYLKQGKSPLTGQKNQTVVRGVNQQTAQGRNQPAGKEKQLARWEERKKKLAEQAELRQKLMQEKATEKIIKKQHEFEQWRIQETEKLETKKQNLRKQSKQIEEERIQLNIDKAHFHRQQEFEQTKKKHEEHLLEMKRQILEGELYKLAEEKRQFEQKRHFYEQVDSYQKEDIRKKPSSVRGEMFFAGVNSQSTLKKRYKDLLKIYHPDNKCGDTDAIQEINREYQRLLEKMGQKG